jgi:hypothetical protein
MSWLLLGLKESTSKTQMAKAYIKTLSGIIELPISNTTSLQQIKEMIQVRDGIPVSNQLLHFSGKSLGGTDVQPGSSSDLHLLLDFNK